MSRAAMWAVLVGALGALLTGCGSFAFQEDTKVAIAITVDPTAPDPVAITAAYKETVFSLVPANKSTNGTRAIVAIGQTLADFDVRYGINAAAPANRSQDYLYAVITQGLATGQAATTLATRSSDGGIPARRAVISHFIDGLSSADLKKAATALGMAGIGAPDDATLGRRLRFEVSRAATATLTAIEDKLESEFSGRFKRYKPKT